MKKIIVDIFNDGEILIETRGFQGPVCLEESQFLKDILGKEISNQLTPMFHIQKKQEVKMYIPICG